jgi:hypothetical protein
MLVLCGVLAAQSASASPETAGEVRLGYVYTDEVGNRSVYQPTYNLYEGAALSLRDFRRQFTSGVRLHADLENITLKNRRMNAGISRSGLFGLDLTGSQYRRTYNFAGDHSTRRDQAAGQVWIKPVNEIKIFGGYGLTNKEGNIVEWFDPGDLSIARATDYQQQQYHAGLQVNHRGSMVRTEYRVSDFADRLAVANDRQTTRFRVVAVTPLPRFRNIQLNGGYQHFRHAIDALATRTSVNTVWGGGTWYLPQGYSLKYDFIFDRANNTGDLVATDNITQAAYAGKVWPGVGGVTLGYQLKINDDYDDEAQTDGFISTGWVKPHRKLTFKGQFGVQREEIKDGATLTGNEDLTRYAFTAAYQFDPLTLRLKHENKKRENDDIGSTADFKRLSADLVLVHRTLGELAGSYALARGDYDNSSSDRFEFTDHMLSGSWLSPAYHGLRGGVEGTYYRSKRDLNVESFSLRLTGSYEFIAGYRLGAGYAAHNFDDLLVNDGYYTANIVEMYISKSLSF